MLPPILVYFVLVPYLVVLRSYSWLFDQESLLAVLGMVLGEVTIWDA